MIDGARGAVEALQRQLRGPVIPRGAGGYDEARRSFNALIDRRPAVIAQPLDASEVALALRIAREHRLPVGVRGGGHSVAGHGIVDAGVVIDLRRMREVRVDAGGKLARAAGGATWEDFDTATQAHGLAVTGGTFVDTGIGGLTLGGGFGYLMGVCGLTCDNLVGAELVTASGAVVEVSTERDPELMWALRGGGGNFGIATRLDYQLFEVGPMYGGEVVVPLGVGAVLRRYAETQVWAPDELTTNLYIVNNPELGPAVGVDVAFLGSATEGDRLGQSILGPSRVVDGELGPLTYADVQALAGTLPFGLRHYWKSAFVGDMTSDVVSTIVDMVKGRPAGRSGILVEPLHGQARRYGLEHACFPQRTAMFHVTALAIWDDPKDDTAEIAWAREVHRRIAAVGMAGTYVNYIGTDEPPDRARSAYPAAVYERLRRIKRRVDPDNVFRSNVNVLPG